MRILYTGRNFRKAPLRCLAFLYGEKAEAPKTLFTGEEPDPGAAWLGLYGGRRTVMVDIHSINKIRRPRPKPDGRGKPLRITFMKRVLSHAIIVSAP